jgi:hypothetical protein
VVTDKTGFRRDFGNLGREKKPWKYYYLAEAIQTTAGRHTVHWTNRTVETRSILGFMGSRFGHCMSGYYDAG